MGSKEKSEDGLILVGFGDKKLKDLVEGVGDKEKEEDNKMFKGIYPMRNIPVHHNDFDHEKLRDLLHNHDGDFVLSYNNCETIRNYYSDFEFYYPEWFYSMGQGETRIGKNRKAADSYIKESHEILIVKRSSALKKVDTSVLYDKVKA